MIDIVIRKFIFWWQHQIAIQRLQALDDRLLADMGTKRQDIACFVAESDGQCTD